MSNPKSFIAPFVRNARFPDLETSIKVADKALEIYNQFKSNYPNTSIQGGACVGLAAIALGYANETIIQNIVKVSGSTMKDYIKSVNSLRNLLNVPINLSFDVIAEQAGIPVRFAHTAQKIYSGMVASDPKDVGLQRPSVYAGVLLAVAVARGHKKDSVLERVSRVTYSDPIEVLAVEKKVKEYAEGSYRLKESKSVPEDTEKFIRTETPKEVIEAIEAAKLSTELDKKKKKKQTTLNFGPA